MHKLNPTVFERAADYIDEHGHWTGEEENNSVGGPTCISNALGLIHGGGPHYQDRLCEHLGFEDLTCVFELNDKMNHAWVTSVLREIAEKIRTEE